MAHKQLVWLSASTGLIACLGSSQPGEEMLPKDTSRSSSSAQDDRAVDADAAPSTLILGPIPETRLDARARIAVIEGISGAPEVSLSYHTRTNDFGFSLSFEDPRLAEKTFQFERSATGVVHLERGGASLRSSLGTVDVAATSTGVRLTFRKMTMESLAQPDAREDQATVMDGSLVAQVDRTCAFRVPPAPGAPVMADGSSAPPELKLDPDWSSSFCAPYRR